MEKVVAKILSKHNGDALACIAYLLGYVDSLERKQNAIRTQLYVEEELRLLEILQSDMETGELYHGIEK